MANLTEDFWLDPPQAPLQRIESFEIYGLLEGDPIKLVFPVSSFGSTDPLVLILSGRNGTGKTTILRMISGMLNLNFNTFRAMPFKRAVLNLSGGHTLAIRTNPDVEYPLWMEFDGHGVKLPKEQGQREDSAHNDAIEALRQEALPILRSVSYQLIELDRVPARDRLTAHEKKIIGAYSFESKETGAPSLAKRVADFVRDAQINYRRFFREEELGFLPKILKRLDPNLAPAKSGDLLARIVEIKKNLEPMRRLGIFVDEEQLDAVIAVINDDSYNTPQQMALIETYVEMQESMQQGRELIANRLLNFERIMEDFLVSKTVEVSARNGLLIRSAEKILDEEQLSSGESHFLYMMVSALLCQRYGTIIAIDEPELSLHVSWQRKLISALVECSSGASPTFLFATHSLAISSAYRDQVYHLSSLE